MSNKIDKKQVENVINAFIGAISDELINGSVVKLEGFGSFTSCTRTTYIGKDIHSGNIKEIPESTYIRFRPSPKMKDLIKHSRQ